MFRLLLLTSFICLPNFAVAFSFNQAEDGTSQGYVQKRNIANHTKESKRNKIGIFGALKNLDKNIRRSFEQSRKRSEVKLQGLRVQMGPGKSPKIPRPKVKPVRCKIQPGKDRPLPQDGDLFVEVDQSPKVHQMCVYKRQKNGQFQLIDTKTISAGQGTPAFNPKNPNMRLSCRRTPNTPKDKFYSIDRNRIMPVYNSTSYSGASMYNSVFIGTRPYMSGIAFHGVDEKYYKYLGKPASGGCIRMTKEASEQFVKHVNEAENVKVRVFDSSTEQEKLLRKRLCERPNIINRCVKDNLASYYPVTGYSTPETEQEKELKVKAMETAENPKEDDKNQFIKFRVGKDYPLSLTEGELPKDLVAKQEYLSRTKTWLSANGGLAYNRTLIYNVKDGERAGLTKSLRVYDVPKKLLKATHADCESKLAHELAAYDLKNHRIDSRNNRYFKTANPLRPSGDTSQ